MASSSQRASAVVGCQVTNFHCLLMTWKRFGLFPFYWQAVVWAQTAIHTFYLYMQMLMMSLEPALGCLAITFAGKRLEEHCLRTTSCNPLEHDLKATSFSNARWAWTMFSLPGSEIVWKLDHVCKLICLQVAKNVETWLWSQYRWLRLREKFSLKHN